MPRQNFIGLVISQGKMHKTVKVRVSRPHYDKTVHKEVQKIKDFLVHDESNICKEGDIVRIESTRPLSPRKYFAVAEIKKNQGQQFLQYQESAKQRVKEESEQRTVDFFDKRQKYQDILTKVNDLKLIDKNATSSSQDADPELQKKINDLKLKYGINTWPPTTPQIELDVTSLNEKLSTLKLELDARDLANQIMEDTQLVQRILTANNANLEAKKHTKKNIINKFILQNNIKSLNEVENCL